MLLHQDQEDKMKNTRNFIYHVIPSLALHGTKEQVTKNGKVGKYPWYIPILMALFFSSLSGCNLPGPTIDADLAERAATVVAMTLTAQANQGIDTQSLGNTPTPKNTRTPTVTITPTYSVPMLKVEESTNCRSGPGQAFEILFTFLPGASVEIVGHHPQDDYWIVKIPDSQETCWIWGEYSTPSGSHWTVPTMTPPAPPTQSPPTTPGNLRYNYFCTLTGELTTDLTWSDRANNEQGYRVFRNGTLVATLPANTTAYSETINININDTLIYSVESFNLTGSSSQNTISFSCK
jgi:hypothetical protein